MVNADYFGVRLDKDEHTVHVDLRDIPYIIVQVGPELHTVSRCCGVTLGCYEATQWKCAKCKGKTLAIFVPFSEDGPEASIFYIIGNTPENLEKWVVRWLNPYFDGTTVRARVTA